MTAADLNMPRVFKLNRIKIQSCCSIIWIVIVELREGAAQDPHYSLIQTKTPSDGLSAERAGPLNVHASTQRLLCCAWEKGGGEFRYREQRQNYNEAAQAQKFTQAINSGEELAAAF